MPIPLGSASQQNLLIRGQHRSRPIAVLAALLLIAVLTLRPLGGSSGNGSAFLCLRCGSFGSVDVLLNTMLFIPLGIGLAHSGLRASRAIVVSLLVTLTVESLQLAFIAGRYASLSDVLSNSFGGGLGFLSGRHWRALLIPSPRSAAIVGFTIAAAWGGSRLLTAWLLVPSLPDSVWYGQIAPKRVYPGAFRGRVIEASFAGAPLKAGPDPNLRTQLLAEGPSISATVTGAEPTPYLSSVVSVFDGRRREIMLLGQEGQDARFRLRLRAADQQFRVPSVRLPGAIHARADTIESITGAFRPGVISLSVRGTLGEQRTELRLGPGLGWALLLPLDVGLTPTTAMAYTAALTAAIMFAIGFFGGRMEPSRPLRSAGVTIALGAFGLWLPAVLFSGVRIEASEALAALVGTVTGALLARAEFRTGIEEMAPDEVAP